VRTSNLGNGFNQFERKKPARASGELQHSSTQPSWSLSRESASCLACFLSFVAAFASMHSSLSREFDKKGAALYS
jgi:hypothetical protein